MNAKLKGKLEQVIDLLDQIDNMLENRFVLKNDGDYSELSFLKLSLMVENYLKNSLDKTSKV